ncbi:Photosynthetic apparatus regulatory protein RegA [Enhygromyxa salina]|uniref:Photosynthetic apparatus regulatory protein RegA n=1 Tax=Enhygromyxa salina TaxID=215803 RepID=A0A2S9XKI8_9BACT|nr:response regulator [Enhygromyxa salina]PRP93399.1 Photosynthetic apparatus regulatory protein RegA [Enhygromyxa salina]
MSGETSGQTIMIVDDDRAFCAALAGALRRRGHACIVAHDYDEALAEALAWRPDRAVIDLRMPGRGGLELVASLRDQLPQLRMVVLTGYGSIASAVEAIKLGAVHYLTKPAEIEEVLAAFERTEPVLIDAPPPTKATPLDELEWEHLQRVLTDCEGNVSEAARRLGMHRRSLQRKLARGRKAHGEDEPE